MNKKLIQLFLLSGSMLLIVIALVIPLTGCESSEKKAPTSEEYNQNSQVLINTCEKLANEMDALRLNQVAKDIQVSRAINCFDYNNECDLYFECLNLAVTLTNDGSLSGQDKSKLSEKLAELKEAVRKGKEKLQGH